MKLLLRLLTFVRWVPKTRRGWFNRRLNLLSLGLLNFNVFQVQLFETLFLDSLLILEFLESQKIFTIEKQIYQIWVPMQFEILD